MILKLQDFMQRTQYKFEFFDSNGNKCIIQDANGLSCNLKTIVATMAMSKEKRWKRKFCRWAAKLPKWGYDVKKVFRLTQFGYDESYHCMKRPQDFEDEQPSLTLTQQGVADPFNSSTESEGGSSSDIDNSNLEPAQKQQKCDTSTPIQERTRMDSFIMIDNSF